LDRRAESGENPGKIGDSGCVRAELKNRFDSRLQGELMG